MALYKSPFISGNSSSHSSRDPSRETSRDPSPTSYLHNQYKPPLQRPLVPPINGQQNSMNPLMPMPPPPPPPPLQAPVRLPQNQQYPPMYNVQNQFQVPVTKHQAPPRDELTNLQGNSQIDPSKTMVAANDQNIPQNSALESKLYKTDNQSTMQDAQTFVQQQEQNIIPTTMQQPRGQVSYQQNLGGSRMYPKNTYGIQHATSVPNTMPYNTVGSIETQPKIPATPIGFPGQRMVPF